MIAASTVVFVHGMFMTGDSWSPWVERFEERGFTCHAPSWPHHADQPAVLRASPPDGLAELTLPEVVEGYRELVLSLEEPPLLVGHSMGGLVVQLLLAEGLGAAGVAIDSAPPKGVSILSIPFLKANGASLGSPKEPIRPDRDDWTWAWAHTLSSSEAAGPYSKHVVPESKRVGKGPTTKDAKIDFSVERAPLLLIAGGADRTIPARLNKKNARAWKKSPSRTDLVVLEDRTHSLVVDAGWEEVAEQVLLWYDGL